MTGVLGTLWKGNKLLATVFVGALVTFVVAPSLLGAITGLVGVSLPMEAVVGIALVAGLFVMGRLA